MIDYRTALRALFPVLLLVCPVASAETAPVASTEPPSCQEHTYSPQEHGTLTLCVPTAWTEQLSHYQGIPLTITFRPADGAAFKVQVTVIGPPQGASEAPSSKVTRSIAEDAWKSVAGLVVETDLALREISGPRAHGHVFSVTDKAAALPPGEYRYMTQGALAVDELLLALTIYTQERDSQVVPTALQMLTGAIRKQSTDTPPAKAEGLHLEGRVLTNDPYVYSLTLPGEWSLDPGSTPASVRITPPGDMGLLMVLVTSLKDRLPADAASGGPLAELVAVAISCSDETAQKQLSAMPEERKPRDFGFGYGLEIVVARNVDSVPHRIHKVCVARTPHLYEIVFTYRKADGKAVLDNYEALLGSLKLRAAGP